MDAVIDKKSNAQGALLKNRATSHPILNFSLNFDHKNSNFASISSEKHTIQCYVMETAYYSYLLLLLATFLSSSAL